MLEGRGLQLEFPDAQTATPCLVNGHNCPRLGVEQIRAASNKPIGTVLQRVSPIKK